MGIFKGMTAELLKGSNEPTPLSLPPLRHSLEAKQGLPLKLHKTVPYKGHQRPSCG